MIVIYVRQLVQCENVYGGEIWSHTCPSESTCQAVKHGVHNKWPHGSIRISLSFSAHILHSWNVLPIKFVNGDGKQEEEKKM